MTTVEIIAKKRDGGKLSKSEISFFINSYLKGEIADYQMSSLLMAVCIRGMDYEETAWLTEIMLNSGDVIEFPRPDKVYVDKHSTGGVGDKVSIMLAPWAASCGAKVPMLSGRGLGHTGGTLDKLETIPGFRTNLTIDEFRQGVEKVGCIITGQTAEIAPADKRMYALRDVTGTVESIPLICGSILSKKLAAGPRGLVFDVKCGNGAFMKTLDEATNLAKNLTGVSKSLGRNVTALITNMNQPLGRTAGNLMEITEAIQFLRGDYDRDLFEITLDLGIEMLLLASVFKNYDDAKKEMIKNLENGKAYEKFAEMVKFQRGDLEIFEKLARIPKSRNAAIIKSEISGYVQAYDTLGIGRLIVKLGGGREKITDTIDPQAGILFHKKIGEMVKTGEPLAELHSNKTSSLESDTERLKSCILISPDPVGKEKLILKKID